jgi:hypothetical protein
VTVTAPTPAQVRRQVGQPAAAADEVHVTGHTVGRADYHFCASGAQRRLPPSLAPKGAASVAGEFPLLQEPVPGRSPASQGASARGI